MTRHARAQAACEEYKPAWLVSGVSCICQNAGQESPDPLCLIKRPAHFTYTVDMLGDFVSRVFPPADITAAHQLDTDIRRSWAAMPCACSIR